MVGGTAGNICAVVAASFSFLGGKISAASATELDDKCLLCIAERLDAVSEVLEQLEGVGSEGYVVKTEYVNLTGSNRTLLLELVS